MSPFILKVVVFGGLGCCWWVTVVFGRFRLLLVKVVVGGLRLFLVGWVVFGEFTLLLAGFLL
ncbi:22381_t:CDS:2, partial [Gigaspora rosea]